MQYKQNIYCSHLEQLSYVSLPPFCTIHLFRDCYRFDISIVSMTRNTLPLLLVLLLACQCRSSVLTESTGVCSTPVNNIVSSHLEKDLCIIGNYVDSSNTSVKWSACENITLGVLHYNTGTAAVTFPSCLHTSELELELYVALFNGSALTDEACLDVDFQQSNDRDSKHSYHVFHCSKCHVQDDDTSTCEKEAGFVKFHHIFSGCYSVKFTPKSKPSGRPYWSTNTVLRTNRSFDPLIRMIPAVVGIPGEEKSVYKLIFDDLKWLFTEKLLMKFWISNNGCYHNDKQSYIAWRMIMSDNSLKCGAVNHPTPLSHCLQRHKSDSMVCVFKDLPAGNYCVTMKAEDPVRCSYPSVWLTYYASECQFHQYFFVSNIDNAIEEPPTEGMSRRENFVLMVGAVAVLVLVLGVIFLSLRVSRRRRESDKMPQSVLLLPRHSVPETLPQVLLLYAQDCQPFMELMATFRELLTTVAKCEVLDCYDPARVEEMALNPMEWMTHRVDNPAVKVVVVASESAAAHQMALAAGIRLQYHQPLPYNQLFLHGFKTLTLNSDGREYTKNFVVRFDHVDLSYLTPYTRFVLPLHLVELLRNLNPNITLQDQELQQCKEVQKLKDNHADFVLYKRRNSSYLSNLMTRSAEVA